MKNIHISLRASPLSLPLHFHVCTPNTDATSPHLFPPNVSLNTKDL